MYVRDCISDIHCDFVVTVLPYTINWRWGREGGGGGWLAVAENDNNYRNGGGNKHLSVCRRMPAFFFLPYTYIAPLKSTIAHHIGKRPNLPTS